MGSYQLSFIFCLFCHFAILQSAHSVEPKYKPFQKIKNFETETIKDEEVTKIAKASLACNLKPNLKSHIEHVIEKVLPRIEKELPELLKPQRTISGEIVQVAENVSHPDLYHVHIRTPLKMIRTSDNSKLDRIFTDSREYHLQYHSTEHIGKLIAQWKEELRQVPDHQIQDWLKLVDQFENSSVDFEYGVGSSMNQGRSNRPKIEALSKKELEEFSTTWFRHQFPDREKLDSPENQRLRSRFADKIKFIDPKNYALDEKITGDRSVFSTDERFVIIQPLNLKDYDQNATIYFDHRKNYPEIDQLIKDIELDGMKYLINDYSPKFAYSSFLGKGVDWHKNRKFMREVRKSVQNLPESIFFHALDDDIDFGGHQFLSWSDQYIFTLRYFLPCKPEMAEMANRYPEDLGIPRP